MSKDWDKLSSVGKTAKLKNNTSSHQNGSEDNSTKPKLINKLPTRFTNAHKQLKESGGTSLNFSDYILEAIREKLQRDGAL